MNFNRGDIILVKYPFTDFTCSKLRPALVVSTDEFNTRGGDIVCVCISSRDSQSSDDVVIEESGAAFPATKLKRKSTILSSKIMTVDRCVIKRRLGHLKGALLSDVSTRIKEVIGLQ